MEDEEYQGALGDWSDEEYDGALGDWATRAMAQLMAAKRAAQSLKSTAAI